MGDSFGTPVICAIDGIRLDQFIGREMRGPLGRRHAVAIITAGGVRVNGRRARKGVRLRAGDVVEVDAAALGAGELGAQPELPVAVLHEDATLIAVDKPPGMPSVALRTTDRDTVANFLRAYAPETAEASRSPLEGGLAHRLDTPTSGVLLAARNPAAWAALRAQFSRRAVQKEYAAMVDGDLRDPGVLRWPIAHDPGRAAAMVVCRDPARARLLRARPAMTTFHPIERRGNATLLAIAIPTGVRHQIRAHLAAIGHPVRGDALYGGTPAERLMLHARSLRLRHPATGDMLRIGSPLPPPLTGGLTP
ncbi:MAG: pseudouridine synthase [Candidatus Binatia bacterium]